MLGQFQQKSNTDKPLKQGADFSALQEEDDDDPRSSINSDIGYFGVGAQHAVFFLGDVEHVMTCAKQPENQEVSKSVRTLVSAPQPCHMSCKSRSRRDTFKAGRLRFGKCAH